MSTSNGINSGFDITKIQVASFDPSYDQLIDNSVLEAMASVYFSEMDLPTTCPSFSFLEETRPIFTKIASEATDQRKGQFSSDENESSFQRAVLSEAYISKAIDVKLIRKDFPILKEKINGKQLIWFDNAATTHKPKSVIDRLTYFYEHENSNIHRGAHTLAARATDAYEEARDKVKTFINASTPKEIIFVRGATEAINLVARSWGKDNLHKDDEVIVSLLEHHANIVPWQMICLETGAKLRVIPIDATGQILLHEYEKLLNPKTKIVAVTHVSNALGTVTPVREIIKRAHQYGAKVLIDGAQAISHMQVDVQSLDCDFYAFSGHKVFAPTGIGVLYGKSGILNDMQPHHGGGNMITDVTFEKTMYQTPPTRFEAGTGNVADAVGLGAAIDYINTIGIENINRYEQSLLEYGIEALRCVPGLRLIGEVRAKAGVISFVMDGFTTEEIGNSLSKEGIAVRSGHHCAQPILREFGLEATVRISLAFYNTYEELDRLVSVLSKLTKVY